MTASLRERFYGRLVIDPDTGCLLWTGYISEDGYGIVHTGGKVRKVHRVAWELANGPIPSGLQLDHLCRVRNCANVDHLEPVTQRVNVMRGQGIAPKRAAQTECIHGHPFTEANTIRDDRGNRRCKTCARRRGREYMRRKRSGRPAA